MYTYDCVCVCVCVLACVWERMFHCSLQSPLGVQDSSSRLFLTTERLYPIVAVVKLHNPLNQRHVRSAAAPATPLDTPLRSVTDSKNLFIGQYDKFFEEYWLSPIL
jgi:hypothetical protein